MKRPDITDAEYEVVSGPRDALPPPQPPAWRIWVAFAILVAKRLVGLAGIILITLGLIDVFTGGLTSRTVHGWLFGW